MGPQGDCCPCPKVNGNVANNTGYQGEVQLTNSLLPIDVSFAKITPGTWLSAFSLVGIEDNTDGREIIISNETAYSMNIIHEDTAIISAGNQGRRIRTTTGSNVSINAFGAARLIYSSSTVGSQGRWLLL
jgi:hypothetical protein